MFTTRSLLLKNQEVKKWLGKNHHKNCLVINLSLYLLWPAIVWKPLSCFDLQDLMIFSQTFPHKNKVRVFIPFYVSSVFNKNIVQSTREGVRYRVSPLVRGLEIDIWGGLITSSLHFLMDPDFSVWFCDEYFQCWRQSWQNSCYCRCRSCVMRALHLGGSNIDIIVQCQQLKSETRFRVILDNLWWVSIVRFLSLKALVGTWM